MNRNTLITAIASAIAFILLVIKMLTGIDFTVSADVITAIATLMATGVLWFVSHYFNQDYSKVAQIMTQIMRKLKELEAVGDLTLLDQILALVNSWEDGEENDD